MREELIYICSPLRAETKAEMQKNAERARAYAAWAEKKYGCRAVAPHGSLDGMLNDEDPAQRALALKFGQDLLALCSKVVVCGNRISSGMSGEISLAARIGIPVEYADPDIGNAEPKASYVVVKAFSFNNEKECVIFSDEDSAVSYLKLCVAANEASENGIPGRHCIVSHSDDWKLAKVFSIADTDSSSQQTYCEYSVVQTQEKTTASADDADTEKSPYAIETEPDASHFIGPSDSIPGKSPYVVDIQEHYHRGVIVYADSTNDAEELADALCNSGEIDMERNCYAGRDMSSYPASKKDLKIYDEYM